MKLILERKREDRPVRLELSESIEGIKMKAFLDTPDDVANNLVVVNTDGTITLCMNVDTRYGFQLDGSGRIKT